MAQIPPSDNIQIAIVCALPKEYDAVQRALGHPGSTRQNNLHKMPGDPNIYNRVMIRRHQVVLVLLSGMGNVNSASAAASLRSSYPDLTLVFVTGICGGNPQPDVKTNILLGDVVVGKLVVQYDLARRFPDRAEPKDKTIDTLGRLQKPLRNFVALLETEREHYELEQSAALILTERLQTPDDANSRNKDYSYPGPEKDVLFPPTHRHRHQSSTDCLCAKWTQAADPVCSDSESLSCQKLGCHSATPIWRRRLDHKKKEMRRGNLAEAQSPEIFFGGVASASTVLKSGEQRDTLAKSLAERSGLPILAFEMEGAGVWDELPCLVVKGVCDYADSHKNKEWQEFAAATAAAVTMAIIERIPVSVAAHDGDVNTNRSHVRNESASSVPPRYIPYPRNEEIVARRELTTQLDELLPHAGGAQTAALCGLGGSGKTQLALDYAYRRCLDETCAVLWVHAESAVTFSQDYKAIGEALGLEMNGESDTDMLRMVKKGIERQRRWLLVVDNADHLGLFGVREQACSSQEPGAPSPTSTARRVRQPEQRPPFGGGPGSQRRNAKTLQPRSGTSQAQSSVKSYLPNGPGGTILWTSRDEHIAGTLVEPRRRVRVSQMTRGEAKELLLKARGDDAEWGSDETAIASLLQELQCFALAISQAGAYMRRTLTDVSDYLSMLREGQQRWRILNKSYHDRHRRDGVTNSVLETWRISLEHIKRVNLLAYRMLHIVTFLDYQNLQWEVLEEAAGAAAGLDRSRSRRQDAETMREAVKRLADFSFLTARASEPGQTRRSYEMHKLVQEGIRFQLRHAQTMHAIDTKGMFRKQRSNGAVSGEAEYAEMAMRITYSLFPDFDDDIGQWPQCEPYFGHCMRLAEIPDYPRDRGMAGHLFRRVSNYAGSRGMWNQCIPLLAATMQMCGKEFDEAHPYMLRLRMNLASSHMNTGRNDEAQEQLAVIRKTCERKCGPENQLTIEVMLRLASLHSRTGHHDEAEELADHVYQWLMPKLGDIHQNIAYMATVLAGTYNYLGYYSKAGEMAVSALERQRQSHGEEHQDTLKAANDLATVFHRQGHNAEAEEIWSRVLELQQRLLGHKHPDTLASMHNLSWTWYNLCRHNDALKLMRECTEQLLAVLGPDDLYTIQSQQDLASMCNEMGVSIRSAMEV